MIGREAISRFFVEMNGDGQIEDVEQQAHTEEGGGLNGFGDLCIAHLRIYDYLCGGILSFFVR